MARTTPRLSVLAVLITAAVAPRIAHAQPPAPSDIYQYAGECVVVRDVATNRAIGQDAFGYRLQTTGLPTPFRMQATALGSYLLYGADARMPSALATGQVLPSSKAAAAADWVVSDGGTGLDLANVATGRHLTVASTGRLTQSTVTAARWRFDPAEGCAVFPEVSVDVEETRPAVASIAPEPVRGLLDSHVHVSAFEFLGGRFHCGRPWSRYGVADAMKDCPDHGPDGRWAIAENLLSTGTLTGTHSTKGWPAFDGWPRYESLTHEGTYWKGIERAWRGGLRVMVSDLVENRALCEIYWLKKNACTDMESLRLQARALYALQDYIDAQFKGPGRGFFRIVTSPAEARAVIAEGKLAVIIGVETSQPFDCLYREGVELCTTEQIDRGLQELWDLGVRSLFPIHKFDNAFGGTAMDGETQGILVNLGNLYMTGRWWEVGPCPGPDADKTPEDFWPAVSGVYAALLQLDPRRAVFDPAFTAPLGAAALPTYPPGPVCNVRGLTPLGEYLITRMVDMGMIIEVDHMSVRTRAQALTILESRGYSGVVTSHSWADLTSQVRIQALGGMVAPYANTTLQYVDAWRQARATRSPDFLWGIGFGTDTNGLGVQAEPRPGAATDRPVTYPFTSADGRSSVGQSQWGTRLWDFNVAGASHYGLFLDWIEDLRHMAGQDIVDDLSNGAEAYLQMWERAAAR